MKKPTKTQLKELEIEITSQGFTIWCGKKGTKGRRWIVDGSCLKSDGEIRLSNPTIKDTSLSTSYSSRTNSISIFKND